MQRFILLLFIGLLFPYSSFADVVFRSNSNVNVSISSIEADVVQTAFDIFCKDFRAVFGGDVLKGDKGQIVIGTIGNNTPAEKMIDKEVLQNLRNQKEGFVLQVKGKNLYILGSDKRGTAYGILEVSRLIGVSPWEWWADSYKEKKSSFVLKDGFNRFEYPSVARRGIFLNDEDWGLTPWSYLTYEPSDVKGQIGSKTHARIFELLLRLRANTLWPAMHDCSVAFYLTPGNKEMADKYGIYIGTSHCEPMMRNTNAEWKTAGTGSYNYVTNRDNVLTFWEERVKELAGSDNIYTLGIRGVHDSKMLGANTLKEQYDVLVEVLKDQREMIAKYVNPDVEAVSQVFIPYKEVLDLYNMGLEVPEDITLLWCDDNYGYLRYFPNEKERARKGGNGVYYHISYWGRPHDYLWLATNHPAQIYTQMKLAYDKGAKEMWILNVGDIKPSEYLTELFLDMAWNINGINNDIEGLESHLHSWLSREFGGRNAKELVAIMNEYYRLSYIRKPEFMAGTRTEESDPKYKVVADLPWSEMEIEQRIGDYRAISDRVEVLSKEIPMEKKDAWFQLVEYPVRGAAEMNKKHLYGQLARHGLVDWGYSDEAFETINVLTQKYNSLNGGKWKGVMDSKPRNLAVFDKVPHIKAEVPLVKYKAPMFLFNGDVFVGFEGKKPILHGLGYERGAITLQKGSSVSYDFAVNDVVSIAVEVALAPNHPVEGGKLRYAICIGDAPERIVEFQTGGRSEEWKENVLTNQAKRITMHDLKEIGSHTLKIKALDEGVIVDQIKIWSDN